MLCYGNDTQGSKFYFKGRLELMLIFIKSPLNLLHDVIWFACTGRDFALLCIRYKTEMLKTDRIINGTQRFYKEENHALNH